MTVIDIISTTLFEALVIISAIIFWFGTLLFIAATDELFPLPNNPDEDEEEK